MDLLIYDKLKKLSKTVIILIQIRLSLEKIPAFKAETEWNLDFFEGI